MIRKNILALCLLLLTLGASAQHAVGVTTIKPYIGLSYASMFNGDLDFRNAIAVGVDVEKRLAKWFAVSGGLAYAPLGGKYINGDNRSFIWKHDYITLPVTANFYPLRGLAFKVGLQPGLSVRNHQEGLNYGFPSSKTMEGDVKPFDLAVPVAISYELYNVVVDVRWNIGVMDIGKSDPWSGDFYMNNSHLSGANFAYQFSIGYQFELK